MTTTATTPKMHTPNFTDENIKQLATLFPHCVCETQQTDDNGKPLFDKDGKPIITLGVDFELLKQELSHHIIDGSQERYRLDWVGKRASILTANSPITKTLRPSRDESVNFDNTANLFIEGDNLDALKLLQKSYQGAVKMIYIDPPYNTGNDFIYNDDFSEDTDRFLERSGQTDEDGNRLVANTESNGRFHSDWLSMMYSRLKIAKNLLSDDGVIFISIDDNEVHNLRKICDEIFGAGNFVAEFVWVTKNAARGVPPKNMVMSNQEYILCYTKSIENFSFKGIDRNEDDFSNPDNDKRGLWRSESMKATGKQNNYFSIFDPVTKNEFYANWAFSKETIEKMIKENLILFPKDKNGTPRQKKFINSYTNDKKAFVTNLGWYSTENSTKFLMSVFDDKKFFDFPKPIDLLNFITSQATNNNDIILDFFAGSSTTAHAVMQLNSEDGGNRKFIMVQLPEQTDEKSEAHKAGFHTISEISKERIRRAGTKIKADNVGKDGIDTLDTGFRVLKIDSSNMTDVYYRPSEYSQDLLDGLVDNIKDDRSDEDLLFGYMLDVGVPLSLPIERTHIDGHTVYQVGGNSLVASLDYIDTQMIDKIAKLNPVRFVSSERAIATDSDKTNIIERFKQLSHSTDVRFI